MADHYHISFSEVHRPLESVCQAGSDPGPTELNSGELDSCSEFIWTRYRITNLGLPPLTLQNSVLLHSAEETTPPASGINYV